MHVDLLQILSQFGAAGLIGLLWVMERRHASVRDRQLTEAHQRMIAEEQSLRVLLDVVRENTRAIAAIERTQKQLVSLAQRLVQGGSRNRCGDPARQAASSEA